MLNLRDLSNVATPGLPVDSNRPKIGLERKFVDHAATSFLLGAINWLLTAGSGFESWCCIADLRELVCCARIPATSHTGELWESRASSSLDGCAAEGWG